MATKVVIKPDSIRIKAFKKARPSGASNVKPVKAKKRNK